MNEIYKIILQVIYSQIWKIIYYGTRIKFMTDEDEHWRCPKWTENMRATRIIDIISVAVCWETTPMMPS